MMASTAFQNGLLFLIDVLLSLYLLVFLLRGLLTLVQADFYNPISQFIFRISEPVLSVLRPCLPPVGRFDFGCWGIAYAIKLAELLLIGFIQGQQWQVTPLLIISFIQLAEILIQVHIIALVILAISSWFVQGAQALNHPVIALIYGITAPLLNPIRRLLPSTGPLDFSVLVALILLYFILTILRSFYL